MSAPAPTPESTKRIAGYEILSKLGQGGMGAVYKARQVSLDRTVALKVLPKQLTDKSEFINRFSREARVTGQLNHSNIIKVYDVGKSPTGICYYSMEFVEGESLRNILEREKRLSPSRTLKILEEMAAALDHAQKHGVIHRDIKPDNILIDKDGNVKLADLGLAKLSEDAASAGGSFASMAGAVVGTPYYMSPEQAEGRTVDTRSDLYSLGATAYHLLTGAPPFTADTPIGVLTKHLTEPLPPLHTRLPAVPPSLEQVIHRLMEKDPARRYQTPAELQTALAQARAAIASSRAVRPVPVDRRKNGTLVAGAVAAGLLLIVVVALAARAKTGSQPAVQPPPSPSAPPKDSQAELRAKEALDRTNEWLTRHPEDLAGGRDLLQNILRDHPDTRAAKEAANQLRDLDPLIAQQKEAAALRARVEPLIAARRFADADAELAGAPSSSEAVAAAVRDLRNTLRGARSVRVEPAPSVEAPRPVETPSVPAPVADDANLSEARKLLGNPNLEVAGLERVKQILGTPPADPQLASQYNRLYRNADARLGLGRTGDLYRTHDWDGVLKESDALRKGPDPLASLLDERDRNWLGRMERQARKNQRLGAWRCDFEHGEAKDWKAEKPWPRPHRALTGSVQALDNGQAKAGTERAIDGNVSLRIGATDKGCNAEAQSPLLTVHPGAVLSLKARLYLLWSARAAHHKPGQDQDEEIAYLCLRDQHLNTVYYDQARGNAAYHAPFARRQGFIEARSISSDSNWGVTEPKVISLDRTVTLGPRFIDFEGKEALPLHLCAGIGLEDVPGRSAVLILDSIEVYYPEEEP